MSLGFEDFQKTNTVQEELSTTRHGKARNQVFSKACHRQVDLQAPWQTPEVLRFTSFVVVSGLAALLNLTCVWFFSRYTPLPYAFYIMLATEASLFCNFYLNDHFTFRSLIDAQGSWLVRCRRFHGPAIVVLVFTLALSDGIYYLTRLPPLASQGVAITTVTFINFAMYNLWAYFSIP